MSGYWGLLSRCFAQMTGLFNAMGRVLHLTQWAITPHIFDEQHTKRHNDAGRSVVHQERPHWQWPPPDGCQTVKPAPMHCTSRYCSRSTVLPPSRTSWLSWNPPQLRSRTRIRRRICVAPLICRHTNSEWHARNQDVLAMGLKWSHSHSWCLETKGATRCPCAVI